MSSDPHHEWPIFLHAPELGEPYDDRAPGVALLKCDDTEGEESKRTAELKTLGGQQYWILCDWERYDFDGSVYWFNRSSFGISAEDVKRLSALHAAN